MPGSLVTLISVFCFFGGIHLQQLPMAFPLETFKRPDVNTAEVKFSTLLAKNVTSVLGFKVLNGQTSEFSYGYHRSVWAEHLTTTDRKIVRYRPFKRCLRLCSHGIQTAQDGKFVRLGVLFTRNYLNRKITRTKIKTPSGLKFRVNRARILNGPVNKVSGQIF